MQRKGFVVGAIVAVLAMIGLVIWANQDDPRPDALGATAGDRRASEDGPGIASAGEVREPGSVRGRHGAGDRPAVALDGGVAPGAAPMAPSARRGNEPQRAQLDENRSAGWRLGQTRARIELVEQRVALLRERVRELEQRGDTENAERQRRILARFENRLAELRTEERDFEAEARRDGTLGEAEQGYQEAQSEVVVRRPVPANLPPQ